jgi:hypothetical protein
MRRDRSAPPPRPPRIRRADLSATFLVRVLFFACLSVAGAIWGVVRHFTHPHLPILVPVPAVAAAPDAGLWDAGAGTIQAPELEPERR